jgi:hypothetical protein
VLGRLLCDERRVNTLTLCFSFLPQISVEEARAAAHRRSLSQAVDVEDARRKSIADGLAGDLASLKSTNEEREEDATEAAECMSSTFVALSGCFVPACVYMPRTHQPPCLLLLRDFPSSRRLQMEHRGGPLRPHCARDRLQRRQILRSQARSVPAELAAELGSPGSANKCCSLALLVFSIHFHHERQFYKKRAHLFLLFSPATSSNFTHPPLRLRLCAV